MPATYEIRDRSGRLLRTVPNVLGAIDLASVQTTSGSHIITVASTAGVYPGMGVCCPNVPEGAFVHAVRSTTEIEVWASAYSASGVWTTSAANAQATATASGLKAQVQGFNPTPVTLWYAEGCWRNIFRGPGGNQVASTAGVYTHGGFAPLVTSTITSPGTINWSIYPQSIAHVTSDDYQATPLKRHEGVPRGVWLLVSTGGFRTAHTITAGDSCGYAAAET